MPELNPLSNEQIFLKKIAENTGSDYNTGDVSEINPLTIDQILLKEIAANTAGQSGDITELEEKVTANTGAIEAIVNEYGAKNELPNNAVSDTVSGVTFTVNANKTITANGTATDNITFMLYDGVSLKLKDHLYSGCPLQTGVAIGAKFTTEGYRVVTTGATPEVALIDDIDKIYISIVNGTVVNNLVFKPMIRDARIKDPTYVPYSMTNRELTDAVNRGSVSVTADGVKTWAQLLGELYSSADLSKITYGSKLVYFNGYGYVIASITSIEKNNTYVIFICPSSSNANGEILSTYQISSSGYRGQAYSGAEHDISSQVVPSGNNLTLYY